MRKFISLVCLFILCLLNFSSFVFAQDSLSDLEKEINDLKSKIESAQSQERTLAAEIKSMTDKIQLTTLEITETKSKIGKLTSEIAELGTKIERLDVTLSKLSKLLINRLIASYKLRRISPFVLLLSSANFTDGLKKVKFLQTAQEHDRKVLVEVQTAKIDYSEKKDLREEKKKQLEELNKQLEAQKIKLDQQKKSKEALLVQTQNNEATYQKLLQQALAEKQAIEAALITGEKVGSVKTGDPIALVGNTGYPACSTGAHLHFEVRKNNQWVNPGDYIISRSIADQQNGGNSTVGNGSWDWPISGNIIITQHYGHTPYSWRYGYSGGIHTGIDMYSNSSTVIRAPKDGTLYSASQNCGGSSVIKIKYIDHGDGLISFYLHVQ